MPIVFVLYWYVFNKNLKVQNFLILVASYIFYGWWDWRFLSLIVLSTLVDYSIGRALSTQENEFKRKALLWTSITFNLGTLGFFKYFNFFICSLYDAVPTLQSSVGFNTLEIILPVGISFYTFQTLSYSIDVYKQKLTPSKDFIAFSAFVCFFPQLVAGPIERATHLLPQFYRSRKINSQQATDGLKQILWGLFKKVVIANNCAVFANMAFNNHADYSGIELFIGALFFTFQIYGDFSGYSDIAIGTSKLFGFDLMKNFATPYFSRDIAEFWRRWHISLSTWFRDYLYIPLGGSKGSKLFKVRNTFIIFIVSGLWHGANWTFVIWGALNAIYFLPLLLLNKNRSNLDIVAKGKLIPTLREASSMIITFCLTVLAWIFFRANTVTDAFAILGEIFSESLFEVPVLPIESIVTLLIVAVFLVIEWLGRESEYSIKDMFNSYPKAVRWTVYYVMIILFFGFTGGEQEFIYFQF